MADDPKPKLIGGLIKVANPEEGLSDEEISAIYAALGVDPPAETEPPAAPTEPPDD